MQISIDEFRNMDKDTQGLYLEGVLEEIMGFEIVYEGDGGNEFFFGTAEESDMDEAIEIAGRLFSEGWPIQFDEDEAALVMNPYLRGMPEGFWVNESVMSSRARFINEEEEEEEEESNSNGEEWKVRFKIGDVWKEAQKLDPDDPDEFDQFKGLFMPKVRNFHEKMKVFMEENDEAVEDLGDIVKDLGDARDAQEWDYEWEKFYEWADENLVHVDIEGVAENDENDNGIDDELENELNGI